MTISVLQEAQNSTGATPVTSVSVTLTGVTAGSFIHVVGTIGFIGRTVVFSDSNSDTPTVLGSAGDTTDVQTVSHAWFGPVAAGNITFTAAPSTLTTSFNGIWVREIGQCSGVQASSNITVSAATTAATVSAQPALWSGFGENFSGGTTPAATTGTQDVSGWTFGGGTGIARTSHARVTATGSVSATYTSASGALIAIFTEAAGGGAIAGTAAVTFGQSGALTGAGALAGTEAIVFGQSGVLKGAAAAVGTTAITFGASATLAGAGALSASAAVTFGANGTLAASGALVGATAIVFDASGTLTPPSGAISGTAGFTFGASGTAQGSAAVSASAAITFGTSGVLNAAGALAGLTAIVFDASGTLVRPGALIGTAAIAFDGAATITASGLLAGAAPIVFGASGSFGGSQPAGKHRKRYGVMDGWRLLLFNTKADADTFRDTLRQRDAPAKSAKALKRIRTVEPVQTINLPELKRALPPPQAARVDQLVRDRQYGELANLPSIAAQYAAQRQEESDVAEVAQVVQAHRQASIAHIQAIHHALKVLTEIRRLRGMK